MGKKERMEGGKGYEKEGRRKEGGGEGENGGREGRRAAVIAHEMHYEDELTGRSERQMQAESHTVSAKAGDGVGLLFSLPLYTFNTDRVRQHSPRTAPL